MFFQPSLTLNKPLPQDYVVKKFFELGYFAQYNAGTKNYSCSCPICREGDTGIGNIKRCFYLPDRNIIYCHRCGWSSRPRKWIKEVGGLTDEEIQKEIAEDDYDYFDLDNQQQLFSTFEENKIDDLPISPINLDNEIEINYYKDNIDVKAVQRYIKSRRLDIAINRPNNWFTTIKDNIHHGRLIIPYYNKNNKIIFYQSRDVTGKADVRYLSKFKGLKSVFNYNKIDFNKPNYYIFEGPFDSCFVKNGVAIGGITVGKAKFSGIQEEQLDNIFDLDRIWILDSQYLDSAAKEKSEILLSEGEKVFIWPKNIGEQYKDFNEIAIDKKLNEIPEKFILDNTFEGLTGILKLKQT